MKLFKNLKQGYKLGNVVQRFIYWNVAVAILCILFRSFYKPAYFFLIDNLSLNSNLQIFISKPWTLLTYSFLHADFIHLLFNMLMLFFIGQLFETFFNKFQFLAVYFFGSIFSGIFYLLLSYFLQINAPIVGASGAIMALLFTITTYRPEMMVHLTLIGRIKIWYLAAFFVLLDLIQIPISNAGGHLAHLGGALFGFIYIQLLKSKIDLANIFETISNFFQPNKDKKVKFKNVYTNSNQVNKKNSNSSKTKDEVQVKIDVILDKISKSGYESLSKEEKEFLFKQR